MMLTLLPPSMLDAKFSGRLGRLIAAGHLASFPPTVPRAKVGSAHSRLVAAVYFATLSASVPVFLFYDM